MSEERRAQVEALMRAAPTIDERKARLEAAYEMVFALSHNIRRAWRMTIPVEPTDTDIVICAALTDARASLSELNDARARWSSVPWKALESAVNGAANAYAAPGADLDTASAWLDANAPKGEPQP